MKRNRWKTGGRKKHFQYIDIQVLGAGRESIGYTDVENVGSLTEDRREKDDVVFYGSTRKRELCEAGERRFRHFLPLGSPSAQLLVWRGTGNGEEDRGEGTGVS